MGVALGGICWATVGCYENVYHAKYFDTHISDFHTNPQFWMFSIMLPPPIIVLISAKIMNVKTI